MFCATLYDKSQVSQLERGEIKFEIQYPQMINNPEDAHPMLAIVKPSHREDFKARLTKLGFDPYSMRPILTMHDIRRWVYVRRNNEPFLSVSFDNAFESQIPFYRFLIKTGMDKADYLVGASALGVTVFAGCIVLVIRKVTAKKQG